MKYPLNPRPKSNPFGSSIKSRSYSAGSGFRFGFGGHENDNEIKSNYNHLSFGDYGYDSRIGKRWTIEPMTAKAPPLTAYAFCFNNPILMFDPNGAWPWPIWVRSFISASDVGDGNFRGDGRGPSLSTANDVTSRTWINFTFDPQKQQLTNRRNGADETILFAPPELGMGDRYPLFGETPKPNVRYTPVSTVKKFGISVGAFNFSYDCKDPITPGLFTPSLDVHSTFVITENLKSNTLFVYAKFTGDVFPSTEAFIRDQSGTKLFLGASKETGGIIDLFGDNKKPLFTVDMQIKFDNKGNFLGVKQGDKLINVDNWNKQIESQFDKK